MSTTIDQKVVEMRFDNRHFEQNVSTTMSTLDRFKRALRLDGATRGLEEVNKASKRVDFSQAEFAATKAGFRIQDIWIKVASTFEQQIANRVVNAATNMFKQLTVAPIGDGFKEYEMTLNAVQTTMAGTGKTAEEVEKELKKLDEYADKTVYSTSDMLNNLPKFTNAGVALEDATKAMIGIANATALAGGDAGKASIAFYNLGQAIGTGYLTRMDYNSINNAGIATMEWKEQMVQAAIAAGTLSKAGDDLYEAGGKTFTMQQLFIDGLQHQWATTDVMMKVFGDYGDETTKIGEKAYSAAQDIKTFSMMMDSLKATAGTGWKDTWQIIFGGLDDAKKFWTGLTNTISGVITGWDDWRNELLGKAFGNPFEGLTDALTSVSNPIETVTESLEELEAMATRVIRGEFGNGEERIRKLTEAGWNYAKVQNIVNERLGSSVRIFEDVIGGQEQSKEINGDLITSLLKLSDAELEAAGCTKEEIDALRELGKYAEKTGIPIEELTKDLDQLSGRNLLINSFKNIGKVLGQALTTIKDAWQNIFPPKSVEDRAKGIYNVIAAFHKFTMGLSMSEDTVDKLRRTFEGFFASLEVVLMLTGGPLKWAFKVLVEILKLFDLDILDVTAGLADMAVGFRNWLKESNLIGAALEKITPVIMALINNVRNFMKTADFGGWFSKAKHGILDWLTGLQEAENVPKYIIDSLVNGIKNGVPHVINAVKYLGELLLNQLKQISGFEDWFDGLISSGSGLVSSIAKWFAGIKDAENIGKYILQGLVNGLKVGADAVFDAVIEIVKHLIRTVCTLLGIHSPSTVFFDIGKNIILGLVNGIKYFMGMAWDIIKSLGEKVVEMIKGLDFGQVFVATISVGMVAGVWKLLDTTKDIATAVKTVVSPLKGLGELLDDVGDSVRDIGKGFKNRQNAEALKSFAIAIAILAASVIALTFVNQDKIWGAVTTIAALAGVILVLGFAASLISKVGTLDWKTVLWLVGISAAMLVMAKVFTTLAGIDVDNALKVVGGFALMIAGLLITVKLMAKFTKDSMFMDKVGVFLIKMAVAMALMVGVVKLASGIDKSEVTKAAYTIALIGALFMAMTVVSKFAGAHAKSAGKMLWKMSLSMLLMVGVVKLAAGLDPSEVSRGVEFMFEVVKLFAAITVISAFGTEGTSKVGGMLLSMSAAMLLMVVVIKQIGKIDEDTLKKGITVMGLFAGIFAVLIAVSHFAGEHAAKAGAMLLAMSAAMVVLVGLTFLLGMMDPKKMVKGLAAITVFSACMAVLIYATKYSNATNELRKTLTTFAVVIGILAALMVALTFINPKKIAVGTAAISAIMGMFATLMVASKYVNVAKGTIKTLLIMTAVVGVMVGLIALMTKLDSRSVVASAGALSTVILAFSAMLIAMAAVSKILSSVKMADGTSVGKIGLILLELVAVAGMMTLLMFVLEKIDPNKAVPNLLALSVALVVLSGAVAIIAGISKFVTKKTAGALLGLVGMIGVMAILADVVNRIPDISGSKKNIAVLTTTLTALSLLLGVLTLVGLGKWNAVIGVGSLAALVLVVWELGAILANIPDVSGSERSVAVLLVTLTALTLLLAPLTLIGLGCGSAILGAISLAALVIVLGGLAYTLDNIPDVSGTEKSVTVLLKALTVLTLLLMPLTLVGALAFAALGGVLALTAMVVPLAVFCIAFNRLPDVTGSQKNIDLLLGVMKVLTNLCTQLAIVGPLALVGITALTALEALVIATGVVAAALGALAMIPGVQDAVDKGIPLMIQLAEGLGNMLGAFLGGTVAGFATSSLEKLAQSLSKFMDDMQPFIDKISNVGGKVWDGAKNLAGAILALTAADLINGIVSMLDNSSSGQGLPALGTELSDFMDEASGFITGAEKLADGKVLSAVKGLAESILILTGAGVLDGLTKLFGGGESSLTKFGEGLGPLGEGIADFYTALNTAGFTVDSVPLVEAAANALSKITAVDIPNTGGVLGWIMGNNDIDDYGARLSKFGTSFGEFITAIRNKGITKEDVDLATLVANALSKITAVDIPNTGGVLGWIMGNNDIDDYGSRLSSFATSFGEFITAVRKQNITKDDVDLATLVANALSTMTAVEIPNTGGVLGWIMGNNDIDDYGSRLSSFATSFGEFITAIRNQGVSKEDVNLAGFVADALVKLTAIEIPNSGGVLGWIMGENNIDDFGSRLPTLGEGLAGFVTKLTNGGFTENSGPLIDAAILAVNNLANLATGLADNWWEKLWGTGNTEAISQLSSNLSTLGCGIAEFAKSATSITPEQVNTLKTALDGINTVLSVASYMSGSYDLKTVGGHLTHFSSGVKAFANELDEDTLTAIKNGKNVIDNLKAMIDSIADVDMAPVVALRDSVRTLGSNIVTNLITGLTPEGVDTQIQNAAQGLINAVYTGLNNPTVEPKIDFKNIAHTVVTNFTTEIKSTANQNLCESAGNTLVASIVEPFTKTSNKPGEYTSVSLACMGLVNNIAYAIKTTDHKSTMAGAGQYLVEGFAGGITDNSNLATTAATSMANAAIAAAKKALGIESPSKVFYEIGGYAVSGFVNSLNASGSAVRSACVSMGDTASSELSKAIADSLDMLSLDNVDQPTIKPVVDLTEVKTGADAIASMMSSNASIGVSANVDSVGNLMQNRQNGSSDLLTAIDKLTKKLDGIRGDSYVINEVNYTEDDGVVDAFQTIIQAARLERRS